MKLSWALRRPVIPASIAGLVLDLPPSVLAEAESTGREITPEATEDLIAFPRRADVPTLPQIAVGHAQFETIHPFTDGNGRTGRALVQAMLRNKGVTRHVTVPVSAGLLTDTGAYFAALTSYRDGDAVQIVDCFTRATVRALANGRQLVADLRDIRERWNGMVTARSDSAVWRVAELLTRRPVVNAALLAQELGIDSTNAHRYLNPLAEAGILTESTNGPRHRVWRSPKSSLRSTPSLNAQGGEADDAVRTPRLRGRPSERPARTPKAQPPQRR